ncbi:Pet127-domain-containing protein [Trichodelitschia bisporula]|uniref:Pet127-domain-containing protein n=1 Tax=Trichodelitschia bisporula TaxID=703511 RepID=A0A6G1I8H5_9PEZI|nr:Pet127-domain-containing protein [Trichodelitschia bisporula]
MLRTRVASPYICQKCRSALRASLRQWRQYTPASSLATILTGDHRRTRLLRQLPWFSPARFIHTGDGTEETSSPPVVASTNSDCVRVSPGTDYKSAISNSMAEDTSHDLQSSVSTFSEDAVGIGQHEGGDGEAPKSEGTPFSEVATFVSLQGALSYIQRTVPQNGSAANGINAQERMAEEGSKGLDGGAGQAGDASKIIIRKHRSAKDVTSQDPLVRVKHLSSRQLPIARLPIPKLAHGLDRVLFNPGIYRLKDPRSKVYNFDPYLEELIPLNEFDFGALREFVSPSKDKNLSKVAKLYKGSYVGSTSSTGSVLQHFHFLLSGWRPLNLSMLSRGFMDKPLSSFTSFQKIPTSIFLRRTGNHYAIDVDKKYDTETFTTLIGHAMERLFTMPKESFEKYRKSSEQGDARFEELRGDEPYRYTQYDKVIIRSQLDAYDPRLPGSGVFDIKTRAVLPARLLPDATTAKDYELRFALGMWQSYERELYDAARTTLLKYSIQVRHGGMDGIFMAYHNLKRLFGFQYLSLRDLDIIVHGQPDRFLGDQELLASMALFQKVLDRVTERFPNQSVRIHFEARETSAPRMYIIAEPVSEEYIDEQNEILDMRIKAFRLALTPGPMDESSPDTQKEPECTPLWPGLEGTEGVLPDNPKNNAWSSLLALWVETDLVASNISRFVGQEDSLAAMKRLDASRKGELLNRIKSIYDGLKMFQARLQGETAQEGLEEGINFVQRLLRKELRRMKLIFPENDQMSEWLEELDDVSPKDDNRTVKQAPEILAMTLSIQNRVDGELVDRPEGLFPENNWEVQYALKEEKGPERAWNLYAMCQTRKYRAWKSTFGAWDEGFMAGIKRACESGRQWRAEEERLTKGQPPKVFYSLSADESPSAHAPLQSPGNLPEDRGEVK